MREGHMAKVCCSHKHLKVPSRMYMLLGSPRQLLKYRANPVPSFSRFLPNVSNCNYCAFPFRIFLTVKNNLAVSSTLLSSDSSLPHFDQKGMAAAPEPRAKTPHVDVQPPESKNIGPSRLVVCFDGTGNRFNGDTSDSNIVKLYEKFDRADPNQFHYYQRKSALTILPTCRSTLTCFQLALAPTKLVKSLSTWGHGENSGKGCQK